MDFGLDQRSSSESVSCSVRNPGGGAQRCAAAYSMIVEVGGRQLVQVRTCSK
jgi:hypothetical protein